MIPEIIEFGQVAELKAAGINYPNTKHQLNWMYRRRHENGLADAFATVAGRNCFLPKRYLELVANSTAA